MYWRIGKSMVVHKEAVKWDCHYWARSKADTVYYDKKPRNCSYCDECFRLEKKARAAGKRLKP
jgi:hypothetical protein